MRTGNMYFEPQALISNFDDDNVVANNMDEDYSNFRFLGIGKPTKKQLERQEKRKDRREATKQEFKGLKKGQKLLNITQKFNPAAAIPRSSALVGVRFNVFGIATKLYPALLTQEELKSRNFNLENAEKAKKAWEKVKKIWIGLGGATPALEQAIRNGYDKPVFKTKNVKKRQEAEKKGKFDGDYYMDIYFDGNYDDENEYSQYTGAEEAAAYISIGLAILGGVSSAISAVGAKKNPYNEGTPEYAKIQAQEAVMEAPPLTTQQQQEIKQVEEAAKKDAEAGKGLDNTTAEQVEQAAREAEPTEEGDKILGMSKTTFWIVTGVVAASAIGFIIWKMKKK